MTEAKHTPGPWKKADIGRNASYFTTGKQGSPVIWSVTDGKNRICVLSALDEAEANAAFIVRACNSHYEMLEALKPKLNAKTRLAVNEWVEAMEAVGGKNERVIASGLRFLLEQEDKRQTVVAKAEGRS